MGVGGRGGRAFRAARRSVSARYMRAVTGQA